MKGIWVVVIGIVIIIGLNGCSCNEEKPPRRAIFNKTSDYSMQYHIILYEPSYGGGTHSFKCGSWSYSPFHIFTDRLGTLREDEVIIKSIDMAEPPYVDDGQDLGDIGLLITRDTIKITGVKGGVYDGTYKVETTSPDSWGIPIDQGVYLPKE